MKILNTRYLLILMLLAVTSCSNNPKANDPDLEFIAAADWRYKALPAFQTPEHFLGALLAIKEIGKGDFMISPGDVEPVEASAKLIGEILGEDYIWYPIIGNHELEIPSSVDYLRAINPDGKTLPSIVNPGPPGTEETTYSFNWGDIHFVVLNVYYDGTSDVAGHQDGSVVPELNAWLDADLSQNSRKVNLVFAHAPMLAIPDMDNGRVRHQGEVLDRVPLQVHQFHKTMLKHSVDAYFCGDTHGTSVAKINGVWQVDVGHARGVEELFPAIIYQDLQQLGNLEQPGVMESYFEPRKYNVKKALYYMDLTGGVDYKVIEDQAALEAFHVFKTKVDADPALLHDYDEAYRTRFNTARSTFIKVGIYGEEVRLKIYRDDSRGGPYTLTKEVVLN
ncbi:metallophosphoesterase family protein [Candidatus Neomarinimicrobiota bacterium]